jgi:hypothetical protein
MAKRLNVYFERAKGGYCTKEVISERGKERGSVRERERERREGATERAC